MAAIYFAASLKTVVNLKWNWHGIIFHYVEAMFKSSLNVVEEMAADIETEQMELEKEMEEAGIDEEKVWE